MELVSIVVPVYNIEKYIGNCVESLQKQTYENIEILLVDDGATDESGSICDRFAQKDGRIRVLHKKKRRFKRCQKLWGTVCQRKVYAVH